ICLKPWNILSEPIPAYVDKPSTLPFQGSKRIFFTLVLLKILMKNEPPDSCNDRFFTEKI
ncbi:hypothetical protein Avbf_14190, partial [Armadillidium vulgare]